MVLCCVLCVVFFFVVFFFLQAEDGIRDLVRSRGLGDVYKRQVEAANHPINGLSRAVNVPSDRLGFSMRSERYFDGAKLRFCLLYTSDAADERSSVDLGGRRIIKKKKNNNRQSDS